LPASAARALGEVHPIEVIMARSQALKTPSVRYKQEVGWFDPGTAHSGLRSYAPTAWLRGSTTSGKAVEAHAVQTSVIPLS